MPAARVRVARFRTNDDIREHAPVVGTVFEQLEGAVRVLEEYLPVRMTFAGSGAGAEEALRRRESRELPPLAVREAVVNAVVHRDYASPDDVQVRVYDNRLEIWNPGGLPSSWNGASPPGLGGRGGGRGTCCQPLEGGRPRMGSNGSGRAQEGLTARGIGSPDSRLTRPARGAPGRRANLPGPAIFVHPDPLQVYSGDAQSLNRYSYVVNNPLRYADPTGHAWEDDVRAANGRDPTAQDVADRAVSLTHAGSVPTASGPRRTGTRISA